MNDLQRAASLYRGLLLFNLVMLIVIVMVYPERFSLLKDPVSWLGRIGPGGDLGYYSSFWLFSAALLFNIFRWNQIISVLSQTPFWEKPLLRIACRVVLAGFILMLFPCDRFDPIHSTGGAFIGLGLWVISTMMLVNLKEKFRPCIYSGLHIIMHSSALFCIISFALNTALKGFSQRPAILAIVLVSNICLHLLLREKQSPARSAAAAKR